MNDDDDDDDNNNYNDDDDDDKAMKQPAIFKAPPARARQRNVGRHGHPQPVIVHRHAAGHDPCAALLAGISSALAGLQPACVSAAAQREHA